MRANRFVSTFAVTCCAYMSGNLLLNGCLSDDPTCAETATCPPTETDAAKDSYADGVSDAPDSFADSSAEGDRRAGDGGSESAARDVVPETTSDSDRTDRIAMDATVDSFRPGLDSSVAPDVATVPDSSDVADGGSDPFPDASNEVSDAGLPPRDISSDGDALTDAARESGASADGSFDAGEACTKNACGGCGPLNGTPGGSCGQCGKYGCSADGTSLECQDPGYIAYSAISNFCGLTTTGQVRCWGTGQDQHTLVLEGAKVLGEGGKCAVLQSGALRCWGPDDDILSLIHI